MSSPAFANNHLFESNGANIIEYWSKAKHQLEALGYTLITADDNTLDDCAGIIFCDAGSLGEFPSLKTTLKKTIKKLLGMKIYETAPTRKLYDEVIAAGLRDKMALIIWEGRSVCPQNFTKEILDKFDHVLTFDDTQLTSPKFRKLWKPIETPRVIEKIVPFDQKKLLINISFNKYSSYKNELYSERRKLSSYFESHYPNDFDLYGVRWNKPVTRLQLMFPFLVHKYSTYRGHAQNKIETMSRYKFNCAYENISDAHGYTADRLFSAFEAKSVPIYWGAPNVQDYIDTDTYIDRRHFKNHAELADFLTKMTEKEYNTYIDAAERFMKSEQYAKFLPENYAKQIIEVLNLKT